MNDNVQLAVRFLKDPKVQQATLAKRISFLESKGLSSTEIEAALALSRSDAPAPTSSAPAPTPVQGQAAPTTPPPLPAYPPSHYPSYNYGHMQQMQQQKHGLDWKDYALGTVGAVAVGYGVFSIAKVRIHALQRLYLLLYV